MELAVAGRLKSVSAALAVYTTSPAVPFSSSTVAVSPEPIVGATSSTFVTVSVTALVAVRPPASVAMTSML